MATIPPPMASSTANWHWKNKNVTAWAKEWFGRELPTISIKEGEDEVSVSEVVDVDGDVELGQRKSKLITIYDCKMELKWTGKAADGTEVAGRLHIPEVSHEITLDGLSEYVWNFSLSTSSSPAVDAVYKLARQRLPTALEAKLAEFPTALINTHGKDLTVSAEPSRSGTPAPSGPTSSATTTAAPPAPAAAPKAAPKKKAVNTTTVTVEAAFMASADDLFSLFTDEKRIPSWTRNSAKSEPKVDTEYFIFGGNIRGKYVTLNPPKEIVQTWSLNSPSWPTGHFATLTTTLDQSSDHTKVTWRLTNVPIGMEEEINRNLNGYYVHGLKSIGYVHLALSYDPPPSSTATAASDRNAVLRQNSSNPWIAVGFAALALFAAFAVPYLYK